MQKVLRVLIVDDDQDDRDLFCNGVHSINPEIECQTARHGSDALYLLNLPSFPKPDIIFLDLNMSRINGVQFLNIIRKDAVLKLIPVVIYTTSKSVAEMELCLSLGAVDFITKPYTLAEFVKRLKFIFTTQHLIYE
jgi:CheY-like chemotaxis protein